VASGQPTSLAPPRSSRRPNHIGSVQASPVYTASNGGGQTLTISSLQGRYIYIVIQVTRDLRPVVFFDWLLPGINFELGVADVTLDQYERLAESLGRNLSQATEKDASVDWAAVLPHAMISLARLLKVCPIKFSHFLRLSSIQIFVDSSTRNQCHIRPGLPF
jgi:CDK inhibitor PHO81